MSIADACVLGAAPNAVGAPEKIFDAVESCACVSRPTTTSQLIAPPRGAASSSLLRAWGSHERRGAVPRRSLRPLGGQRARLYCERGALMSAAGPSQGDHCAPS